MEDDPGWACGVRIDYADGEHETRVLRTGTEAECDAYAQRPTLLAVDGAPDGSATDLQRLTYPAGRHPTAMQMFVCRANRIDETVLALDRRNGHPRESS